MPITDHQTLIVEALDALRSDGFTVGPGWQAAHEIAQAHEGNAPFDRLHALCHRIEGDEWNAGYWYRRAGREPEKGAVEEEWARMRAEVSGVAGSASG